LTVAPAPRPCALAVALEHAVLVRRIRLGGLRYRPELDNADRNEAEQVDRGYVRRGRAEAQAAVHGHKVAVLEGVLDFEELLGIVRVVLRHGGPEAGGVPFAERDVVAE